MNREILFRGKREDGLGDWVYGYLIIEPDGTNWIDHYPDGLRRTTKVIPATVGQFTGLTDKNGVKIFEGDVVFIEDNEGQLYDYVVKWDSSSLCFIGVYNPNLPSLNVYLDELEGCEVIGNIHDNTELIKRS